MSLHFYASIKEIQYLPNSLLPRTFFMERPPSQRLPYTKPTSASSTSKSPHSCGRVAVRSEAGMANGRARGIAAEMDGVVVATDSSRPL